MAERKAWIIPVVLLIAGAVLGGVAWYFRDYFEPPPAQVLSLDDCDLHQGPCRRSLPGGGEVLFSIEPRSIPLTRPLKLKVQVKGARAQKVEVDFSGVTMNMGYNRPQLKKMADGSFVGDGLLPVCIRQRMDWEAKVILRTDRGGFILPWRFETVK
ncbi:hypothetical protein [Thiolapillus brandeum]|uniref:Uncharacterized protein n=1 Tax=Thiolapillus brandeum TaxID=1076588 RepID=A0A7U6JHD5_9GAMM|nr:hypothetical protein [Thiolapillus brandeum]BAO43568.1 conserved hypothetical protein [Thiolapillus brandeum]